MKCPCNLEVILHRDSNGMGVIYSVHRHRVSLNMMNLVYRGAEEEGEFAEV